MYDVYNQQKEYFEKGIEKDENSAMLRVLELYRATIGRNIQRITK